MAIWNRLGINIGNNFNWTTTYPSDQVNAELSELYAAGFRYIRIAHAEWDNAGGIANVKQAALDAKAKGFYVMSGLSSAGTTTLTSSNWSSYRTSILDFAAWAQTNGINEFQVGNELESFNDDATLTDSTLRSNIRTLGTDAKAAAPSCVISYSVAQGGQNTNWVADNNKGGCDFLYLNVYGQHNNFPSFKSEIDSFLRVYKNGRISEFNIDPAHVDIMLLSDLEQMNELEIRMSYLIDKGISLVYFFTWRWSGTDQFALKKTDGTYRSLWYDVLFNSKKRRSVIYV